MRKTFATIFSLFLYAGLCAQGLGWVVEQTNDRNLIAAPALGDVEPTVFEASINPFKFFSLDSGNAGIELAFKSVLRMLNSRSCPIYTPSYMPSVSAYKTLKRYPDSTLLVARLTLGHHSNGQNGPFYTGQGDINTVNGNFATDFIRIALINEIKGAGFVQAGFEQHLNIENCRQLVGMYGLSRLYVGFQSHYLELGRGHFLKAGCSNTWISGRLDQARPLDINARLVASLMLTYRPAFAGGFALFAQYYRGQDYYNINFTERLSFMRLGICLEPSALPRLAS